MGILLNIFVWWMDWILVYFIFVSVLMNMLLFIFRKYFGELWVVLELVLKVLSQVGPNFRLIRLHLLQIEYLFKMYEK